MGTTISDGRAIAKEIRMSLSAQTAVLQERGITPQLAVIHIGEDPASLWYTKSIKKIASKLNIEVSVHMLPETAASGEVLNLLDDLKNDIAVHGIIIQEPIPDTIDKEMVLASLAPMKDIDCMNPLNLGKLIRGTFPFAPSTPLGVLRILEHEEINVEGKHVVIVGRSAIVGKPLANLLLLKAKGGNATVTVCHSRTAEIAAHTRLADIIIVAVGQANFLKADMVTQGAVVIDVGTNDIVDHEGNHVLVGDVDFESVKEKTSIITPVPGGVGPVTTLMLFSNLLTAVKMQTEHQSNE
jgi:methylenetetrahydrofolate dehydrogenase (NADP+)/methenyltetrahydrofolate cyclohydrolase